MTKSISRARLERTRRSRDKRRSRNSDLVAHTEAKEGSMLRASGDPLTLTAAEGDDVLPSFSAVAYTGGPMYPKLALAWNGPVVIDLAGLESNDVQPIHRDHDESRPIGHSTAVANDGRQLMCSGIFSVPCADTTEIVESSKQGFPWRPSVGVKIGQYTTLAAGQTAQINGRIYEGPVLWVKRSTLKEVSLVTIPGDDSATISISASVHTMKTFEEYVAGLGLDMASLTAEAVAALQVSYAESMEPADAPMAAAAPDSAQSPPPQEKPMATASAAPVDLSAAPIADISAYRAMLAAETSRSNGIRDLTAKFSNPKVMVGGKTVDLAAHAIEHGWTSDQTELVARRHLDLEAARDSRPRGPAIHSHSAADRNSIDALQAGLLLRANCSLESPQFENRWVKTKLPQWLQAGINSPVRQRAMDAGHALSDLSLVDACRLGLQARGIDVPSGRMDMIQASFSTGSAAALFGATIGAKMLESYAEVVDFSEGWCSVDENPDLEQHNRNRTQAANSLVYHPVGGEAPHAGRTVITEKAQVFRFSRQMKIDEADILGDNFGKFKDSPRDFGLAAGRVRPDMVAAVLLSNANLTATGRALFNSTDGNVATSAALTRANLSALIAAIRKRKDGDATLDLPVTHLLVPPDLLDTALQLCYSVVISNDSGAGNMNPVKAYGITPISEPRLSNGLAHPVTGTALAGSATTYYGVSNRARTIEVTYLAGAGRTPVVRSETLVGGEFGLAIDVRHYVGATALDWRGFQRQVA